MPTSAVPETGFAPDQSPLATHEVGLFVTLQLSVALWPTYTPDGVAAIVTVGLVAGLVLTLCSITPTVTVA